MNKEGIGRPWRIGLNAHLLAGRPGYRRAGIHTYIAQLLNHLPVSAPDLEFFVFTNSKDEVSSRLANGTYTSRWPTSRRLFRIGWEQVSWPLTARREELDLIHAMAFVSPLFSPCPTVVIVYELSFI